MKVRLKTTFADPNGRTGQAGEVLDLPDDQARTFLENGNADEVPADLALAPAAGSLTMAGSFGGTSAAMPTSGQTPGIASGAPDPLLAQAPGVERLAVPTEVPAEVPAEQTVNLPAIESAALAAAPAATAAPEAAPAAPEEDDPEPRKSRKKG